MKKTRLAVVACVLTLLAACAIPNNTSGHEPRVDVRRAADGTTQFTVMDADSVAATGTLDATGRGELVLVPERRSTRIRVSDGVLAKPSALEASIRQQWVLAVGSRTPDKVPYMPVCSFRGFGGIGTGDGCWSVEGLCSDDQTICYSYTSCCGSSCFDESYCLTAEQ